MLCKKLIHFQVLTEKDNNSTLFTIFPDLFQAWKMVGKFQDQGGLATAFDLAAFRLSMIAPVKKSVNHSTTVASMRETGWEQQQHQEVHLGSDSTV